MTEYHIILACANPKDQEKFGRDLKINSFESATATFKTLVKAALEEIIDPFVIKFYYGDREAYVLEKKP